MKRAICWMLSLLGTLLLTTTHADDAYQVGAASRYSYPPLNPGARLSVAIVTDPKKWGSCAPSFHATSTGPGDTALLAESVSIKLEPEPDPAGKFTLQVTPQPAAFAAMGDYHIVIDFSCLEAGTAKRTSQLIPLQVTRPELQLEVDHATGKSVTLYRSWPGAPASGTVPYTLETAHPYDAAVIALTPRPVQWTKEPGTVLPSAEIAFENGAVHLPTADAKPAQAMLTLKHFAWAGDFDTTIRFASDALSKPIVTPLTIHVKDCWPLPLLFILAGVVAGAVVTYASGNRRAMLLTRFSVSQLKLRLERLSVAIASAASENRYTQAYDQLKSIEDAVYLHAKPDVDLATVTTEVTSLEKDLSDLRAKTGTRLDALDKQTALMQRMFTADVPDIAVRAAPIHDLISVARQRLAEGQTEFAEQQTTSGDGLAAQVAQDAQLALVAAVTQRIKADQKLSDDATLGQLLTQLRSTVAQPLEQFLPLLEALRTVLPAPAFTASGPVPLPSVSSPAYWIDTSPPTGKRLTEAPIIFTLGVAAGLNPPDLLLWKFGDGHLQSTPGLSVQHTYAQEGTYEVAVQLLRAADPAFQESARTRIEVLPGPQASILARTKQALKINDWLLLGAAFGIAVLTGFLQLYVDKPFGTFSDYLSALLWGFGVEKTVQGFKAIATTLGNANA